jgi:hypothetical protein
MQILLSENSSLFLILENYDAENLAILRKGLLQLLSRSHQLGNNLTNDCTFSVFDLLEMLLVEPEKAGNLEEMQAAYKRFISENNLESSFKSWLSEKENSMPNSTKSA